eukprot:jgi/Ulvmu1/10620/UM065_0077.1
MIVSPGILHRQPIHYGIGVGCRYGASAAAAPGLCEHLPGQVAQHVRRADYFRTSPTSTCESTGADEPSSTSRERGCEFMLCLAGHSLGPMCASGPNRAAARKSARLGGPVRAG